MTLRSIQNRTDSYEIYNQIMHGWKINKFEAMATEGIVGQYMDVEMGTERGISGVGRLFLRIFSRFDKINVFSSGSA